VPADMSVNVPVRLAFINLHEQRADWLTESKEVKPGLLAAHTLLNDDDTHAAIRFINSPFAYLRKFARLHMGVLNDPYVECYLLFYFNSYTNKNCICIYRKRTTIDQCS